MSSWQEQLYEAIEDGNTSLITTLISTEGLESHVDRKVFFSRIAYKGPKKSFVYVAQSSAQTSLSTLCSVIGVVYVFSGCLVAFALMASDREFYLAPSWLTTGSMLVFTPIPFFIAYYTLFVAKESRPDATLMHVAAWCNQPLVVRLLRTRYNASVSVKDRDKRLPRDVTTNHVVQRELAASADST